MGKRIDLGAMHSPPPLLNVHLSDPFMHIPTSRILLIVGGITSFLVV